MSIGFHSIGQYHILLNKPYSKNINNIQKLYEDLISLKDNLKIDNEVRRIKNYALTNKDAALSLEMDLFSVYYNIEFNKDTSVTIISALNEIIKKTNNYQLKPIKIRAIRVLADYYWSRERNYELAFEQYLLLGKEIESIALKDYPEKPRDLIKIGQAYYFFRNYEQAEFYLKKMLLIPQNRSNVMFMNAARNTLGLCYQKQGLYEKSDYYFNQILHTPFREVLNEWGHIAKGNLGANLYLQYKYNDAIPLLEYDYKQSKKITDYGPAAGASILLGDIFLKKQQQEKSYFYLSEARKFIHLSQQQNERLSTWFTIMSKWQTIFGDRTLANNYLDSAMIALHHEQKEFNAIQLLKAQQKINQHEKTLKETSFKLENQKRINQLYLMVSLLIILIIFIVFRSLSNKKKQQQNIIEKLQLENNLNDAKSKIELFIAKIDEQNLINERLTNQFKDIKFKEEEDQIAFQKSISTLKTTKILTDDDWISFKASFEKIHPDFIFKLKQKFPSVTEAETRYLMLSLLQLSHKEMAIALGVSSAAIRVTWSRVKKKLNGSSEDTAESLIERINATN